METDFHGLGMLFAYYHSKDDAGGARRTAERVVAQVEKVLAQDPENGAALAFGAISLAVLEQPERAQQWIDQALLLDPDNSMMRYNLAWGLNKIFNDKEAALDMLGQVLAHTGANIVRLAANDPNLDSLRDDPRFQQMLGSAKERVGLASPASANPAATSAPLRS